MNEWLKNAVFYEIYPQSFKDSNADGIGDFNGIIEKLDYIKDMGFTAIWMNPCFKSPFSDAGYDIEDYYSTAPRYGTNEDLKRLFEEVHKRDMHIILDLVPGHTSVECKWFKESLKPEKNAYSDRYIWTNNVWTDCAGYSSITGSLRGISARDGSCAVNFFSSQPALNYGFAKVTEPWQYSVDSNEAMATRNELYEIIRFWLLMGCDGFRVDMAASLVKEDDEQKETIKLWQDIFGKIKREFPQAAFVSEWGEPDKSLESGFDMDFLLHFGPSHYPDLFRGETPYFSHDGKGNLTEFFKYYTFCLKKTNGKGFICFPSGNHDMERIANKLDETEIKLSFAFIMSMPGIPFIYYGDEIGMRYIKNLTSVEGGFCRTGSRTPMQWDNNVNSGFSSAAPDKLYLPIDPSDDRPTVEKQTADKNSILNELKKLINIRKRNQSLQESAGFELVSTNENAYPLIYKRTGKNESILVAINPTDDECRCTINESLGDIIYNYNEKVVIKNNVIIIPPCSASYIRMEMSINVQSKFTQNF